MKTNPNEPINPVELQHQDHEMLAKDYGQFKGLTKREYFAAMAMQGLLVNGMQLGMTHEEEISKQAVVYADALISELNK